jgi:hypothetical protein
MPVARHHHVHHAKAMLYPMIVCTVLGSAAAATAPLWLPPLLGYGTPSSAPLGQFSGAGSGAVVVGGPVVVVSNTTSPPIAVPEPSSLALVLLPVLAIIAVQRVRHE